MKKENKGFTLIEMIVVIVIIAILAAVAVPGVMKYIDEARNTKLITKANSARTLLETELLKIQAKNENGRYDLDGEVNRTNFRNAMNNVKKEMWEIQQIDACTSVNINDAGKGECEILTKDKRVQNIKGYRIMISTGSSGQSECILIELDGSADIAPEGSA